MSRRTWIIVGIAAAAVAAYLAWRWYRNRETAGSPSPTGALGTNLNSVAPELIGGSTGPSLGPAVSLPVNITLTSNVPDYASQPPRPIPPRGGDDGGVDADGLRGPTGPAVPVGSDVDPGDVEGMNDLDTTTPAGITMQPAGAPNPLPIKRGPTGPAQRYP